MTLLRCITRQPLDHFLAALAGAVCLVISVCLWGLLYFTGVRQGLGPGLYVLEMLLLCLTAVAAVLRPDGAPGWLWGRWPWISAGAIAGFVVMGLWSIGLAFPPVALLLVIAALAADRRQRRSPAAGLGLCLLAAAVQAAGMLALVTRM